MRIITAGLLGVAAGVILHPSATAAEPPAPARSYRNILTPIENPTPKATIVETSTVKQLGIHLIKPYIITIEILALLLTAALVGAVTAAQGGRAFEKEESNK